MVVEQALQDRLAIVERAFERDRVDVVRVNASHLPPLHVRDALVRIHDEHVDLFEPAEGFDRRRARIARRRAHDGGALAALLERMVHHAREQLHRHVLEGERGAVEEFEHEEIVADLRQRRHRRMAERRVGLLQHVAEGGRLDLVAHEGADDALGDPPIGLAGEPGDLVRGNLRKALWHIEAAVARQPRQHGVGEREDRGFAAG